MSTIDSHYFRKCVYGAARHGLDTRLLYENIGVDEHRIQAIGVRENTAKMVRLLQDIWAALDDEFFGFTRTPCPQGIFAAMAHITLNSERAAKIFSTGARFYSLVTDDVHMRVVSSESETTFEIELADPALDPDHLFLELWLVTWHRFACWMTSVPIPIKWADFPHRPTADYVDEFRFLFPCEHRFHMPRARLAFDTRNLDMPIVRSKSDLKEFLRRAPYDSLVMPNDERSLSRMIRAAILPPREARIEFPPFERIASRFGMSGQTMRRRLRDDNTSYRQIKESIRREFATRKLVMGYTPISEISNFVGFAETRSFTRAFRDWTGISPGSYRKRYHQDRGGTES